MTKKIVLPLVVMTVLVGTFLVLPKSVNAANGWFSTGPMFTKLVDFISQKFNLDKSQVQTAMTEFKDQQKANITPRPTMSPQDIQNRKTHS